jgi:hypothetical protein
MAKSSEELSDLERWLVKAIYCFEQVGILVLRTDPAFGFGLIFKVVLKVMSPMYLDEVGCGTSDGKSRVGATLFGGE